MSLDTFLGALFAVLFYKLYRLRNENSSPMKTRITVSIAAVYLLLYYSVYTEIAEVIMRNTEDNHQTSIFQLINIDIISNLADFAVALSLLLLFIRLSKFQ